MFSKACEYGLKAMIFIASSDNNGKLYTLDDISENIGSPISFTSKVLQQLTKAGLLISKKGPTGGFLLGDKNIANTNLYQIVKAIDGDSLLKSCGLGLHTCNDKKPCPLHNKYSLIRDHINQMLQETSLIDFTGKLTTKDFFLTR